MTALLIAAVWLLVLAVAVFVMKRRENRGAAMTTIGLRDWAPTWRRIPVACDLLCKWRGPFPRSEHTWQLPEDAADPACTIHGDGSTA